MGMGAPMGCATLPRRRSVSPVPGPAWPNKSQVAGRRGRLGGRTTPADPGRRGSRDNGQAANMVLLVVQIETGSPEQRIGTCGDGGFMMHEQR